MIQNYLKIALRNLLLRLPQLRFPLRVFRRHPVFSALNIGGLALGIAASFVLMLYVRQELTYERHIEDHERIYRVATDFFNMGGFAKSQNQLLDHLPEALPELEIATRFDRGFQAVQVIANGDTFDESAYFFVDSTYFKLFTYTFLEGSAQTAMRAPDVAVISEQAARKYFSSLSEAMGRTLLVGKEERAYRVEGVVASPAAPTHLLADLWLPLEPREPQTYWTNIEYYNYVKLRPGGTRADLERALERLRRNFAHPAARSGDRYEDWVATSQAVTFDIQPLTDIHLHSSYQFDIAPSGNPALVYGLGLIGLFIILVAGANYVNLTTAYSSLRAREIGVKKTLGARRGELVVQFLGESVVFSLAAALLAAGIASVLVRVFDHAAGGAIIDGLFTSSFEVLMLVGFAVAVGLAAGLYPAIYLSSFRPVRILKGAGPSGGGGRLRSGLVVMQFAIATGLGIGSIAVYNQLSFMRDADKGFDHEGVLVIENADVLGSQAEAFRQEVERRGVVTASSFAARTPTASGVAARNYRTPEMNEAISIQTFPADEDFLPTLGMRLSAGRNFSDVYASDTSAVILNEAAVRVLGLGDQPVGKMVNDDQEVIGVVGDFHFRSFRDAIEPVALTYARDGRQLLLKLEARSVSGFTPELQELWRHFVPDEPMRFGFLDENFDRLARDEQMLSRAVTFFTVLALLIACGGLFGLTAFAAQRRTKEIGIRKVFGATAAAIVVLLSKEVARLVLIAFFVAVPAAYLLLHEWLGGFAYRVDLGLAPFVIAGAGALGIALLTVSYHAIRAAYARPATSLRYE